MTTSETPEESEESTGIEVDDPDNVRWRWHGEQWQFLGSDGTWYVGEGPPDDSFDGADEDDGSTTWRRNDGDWQRLESDGYWHNRDVSDEGLEWRQSETGRWEYRSGGRWLAESVEPEAPAASISYGTGAAYLAIIGGLLVIVGAFLPTLSVTGIASLNRNAFQLGKDSSFSWDGPICLALGVVIILVGITRLTNTAMPPFLSSSTIWTGGGAIVSAWFLHRGAQSIVNQVQPSSLQIASVGTGVWAVGAGGAMALLAGIFLWSAKRPEASVAAPDDAVTECPDCGASYTSLYPADTCGDCGAKLVPAR